MAEKGNLSFFKKHKILTNILIIAVFNTILITIAYFSLNWYTHHNEYQIVPELKGMTIEEASTKLSGCNLKYEISDSIFDTTSKPGTILLQTPKAGSKFKRDRTVYITIRSFATKQVKMPSIIDQSLRQGMSALQSLGIKNITVERIESEYEDLIFNVKMNGLPLRAGDRIPINAKITIVAGDGSIQITDDVILEEYNEFSEAGGLDEETEETASNDNI